jgi:diguanylate cyclase (GGDEF)-like protein
MDGHMVVTQVVTRDEEVCMSPLEEVRLLKELIEKEGLLRNIKNCTLKRLIQKLSNIQSSITGVYSQLRTQKDEVTNAVLIGSNDRINQLLQRISELESQLKDRDFRTEKEVLKISEYYEGQVFFYRDKLRLEPMSGLINSKDFRYLAEISMGSLSDSIAVFGYIDIADFKDINESFGHPAGDAVIQTISGVIKSNIRSFSPEENRLGDIRGRVGGDEFSFFITKLPDVESMFYLGERLIEAVNQVSWDFIDPRLRVYANLGLVGIFFKKKEPDGLLHASGERIYSFCQREAELLMREHKWAVKQGICPKIPASIIEVGPKIKYLLDGKLSSREPRLPFD